MVKLDIRGMAYRVSDSKRLDKLSCGNNVGTTDRA